MTKPLIVYHRTMSSYALEAMKSATILGQDFLDEVIFTNNRNRDDSLYKREMSQYLQFREQVEKALNELLASNPNNKLAFEYMMAFYLLTRQVDKIAANINRLDDFGYERLPRYYDEAMAIYSKRKGTDADVPKKWMPSKQALKTADTFSDINERTGANRKAAMQHLAKAHGNSYFFYYLYGTSGAGL